MRALFGCLAVFLGTASISLAARYGYKGADTVIDGSISALVFGSVACCAFLFDAAAVRLWFMGRRLGAMIVGLIAAAAFVVTVTNSLGAMAGRDDVTQAERVRAKAEAAADRAKLMRLEGERARLVFTPANQEDVQAAREAVMAAERMQAAECNKRGPRCHDRETEEQAKREALGLALANKALTAQAAKLDDEAAALRIQLAKAQPVQNANPLGAALEQIIGSTAAVLTAWQKAVVATVFDLCLLGVMVVYELLGHDRGRQPIRTWSPSSWHWWRISPAISVHTSHAEPLPEIDVERHVPALPAPASRKPRGSVKAFIHDRVSPADGERVEVKALLKAYRVWCSSRGVQPVALAAFLEDIDAVCRKIGIEITNEADRVFCLGLKIEEPQDGTGRIH